MARTRIKICGVSTIETSLAAADAGADAIGLVFHAPSPRRVDVATARAIVDALPPLVEPIGLFVDMPAGRVSDIAEEVRLRTVQLHGSETPADAAELLERRPPLHVIKALHFEAAQADATLRPWREAGVKLAGILWDTPARPGAADAELPGGSGRRFDWASLARHGKHPSSDGTPPVILAGGLTAANVGEAIRTVRPFAVDVSSGVESQRGVKDPVLIRAFCAAVRTADAALNP